MTQEINVPSLTLHDGTTVPAIGFGTYKLKGAAGVDAMVSALDVGYRLLDSAFNYENEGSVGEAVRRSGIARDDIRVVSKLPGRHHPFKQAIETIEESLYRAQLDYYDVYLIHWPNPNQGVYVEAWQALIEAKKRGCIRSIGVCNFLPEHINTLISETGEKPSINQIELHPYFPQAEQRSWDAENGILTQSWSPLGRANDVLENVTIQSIANRLGKTIPQIILRWHVQLGAMPIPKASSRTRQIENLSVFDFDLTTEDMNTIASLSRPDGRLMGQDPAVYEEF